jgi:hydroxyacylglutathione hydrolase
MIIHTLSALKDNFIYILEQNGKAAVVDPGEALTVRKFLDFKKLHLEHILCTHHHSDHVAGISDLLTMGSIKVWASRIDGEKISGVTDRVFEGETYSILGESFEVLEVPGHTLGQVSFHFPRLHSLFVGDTLFSGGCGRIFEGTLAQMFSSLQKFKKLPMATRIYFGHEYTLRNLEFIKHRLGNVPEDLFDYEEVCRENLGRGEPTTPTNLAQELKINPFLYSANLEDFSRWREARNHF